MKPGAVPKVMCDLGCSSLFVPKGMSPAGQRDGYLYSNRPCSGEISAGNGLIVKKREDRARISCWVKLIWLRHVQNRHKFARLSCVRRLIWFDPGRNRALKPTFAVIAPARRSAAAELGFDPGRHRAPKPTSNVISPGWRSTAAPLHIPRTQAVMGV